MKIHASHDRCRGAGQCALTAPEIFDQSEDDGTVVVLNSEPPPELHVLARRAASLCPNTVIRIVEQP